MPVYFDKDKDRWRFTFNRIIGGQRYRANTLLPRGWGPTNAEAHDRKETARLYAVATGVEQPEPLIGKAVALYLKHRIPKLRDGKGIAQELAHLIEHIDGKPMSALANVSRDYGEEMASELEPATIRNRLAYLRAACRYAWKKHKLTPHDPTGQMELPSVDNIRDVHLPVEGYEKRILRRISDHEARALFTLAFYTGSRWPSEILPRQPDDVHRIGRKVMLQVGKTKNGSPRLVPVHPKARWTLAYLPFPHAERWYYERFNKAREDAGLPDLVPHSGRHIVATDILLNGGTLADVSAALHHKHWGSSARYAHLVTEHTERVLFRIGRVQKNAHRRSSVKRKKAA
jgi:integrase